MSAATEYIYYGIRPAWQRIYCHETEAAQRCGATTLGGLEDGLIAYPGYLGAGNSLYSLGAQ